MQLYDIVYILYMNCCCIIIGYIKYIYVVTRNGGNPVSAFLPGYSILCFVFSNRFRFVDSRYSFILFPKAVLTELSHKTKIFY